jgi:hypothetical protein
MQLTVTVDRFEGDKAVLITSDGKVITWPREKLPPDTPEGSILKLSLSEDTKDTSNQRNVAKEILNEILNP